MPISSVLWFPARDFKLGRVGGREGGGISKVRICPFDLTPPLGLCIRAGLLLLRQCLGVHVPLAPTP